MCKRSLTPLFYSVFDLRHVFPNDDWTVHHRASQTSPPVVGIVFSSSLRDEQDGRKAVFGVRKHSSSIVDGSIVGGESQTFFFSNIGFPFYKAEIALPLLIKGTYLTWRVLQR